jgi:hypothetical protein
MVEEFDLILDNCIDRLNRGESLEKCLADYPTYADRLEPLLKAVAKTRSAYSFVPSEDVKRATRQKLYSTLERRHQPSFWQRVTQPRLAWVSAVSVILLLAIGLVLLRPVLWPALPWNPPDDTQIPDLPSISIPSATADGNFIFMVSDDVNAIADFTSVNVTIEKVWLLKTGEQENWIEFTPSTQIFNLALLPGDKTQTLWQGNVPIGEYTRVVIIVSQVTGTLEQTGEIIDIKLPSNKLQVKIPFNVSADSITSFTFDLTVVKTGNAQDGGKYLLKPQAGESGASQVPLNKPASPNEGKGQGEPKN